MTSLPNSIPRATNVQDLFDEPLGFLARARSALGDLFVLREDGPLFSRSPTCTGTVAVFGAAHNQAVLSDIDVFGMPISAAQHLSLPNNLVNLNRGLHSMRGEQHDHQHRLLMRLLSERCISDWDRALCTGLERFCQEWRHGEQIALLSEMRKLTLDVSSRLLFGDDYAETSSLTSLLQKYFHFRREVAAPFSAPSEASLAQLVELGNLVDKNMRRYIRWSRQQMPSPSDGLLSRLARLESEPGKQLPEDEMVAHGNVLFMSTNEPIAIAMTWTLLILSQLPELREALREEFDKTAPADTTPTSDRPRMTLLDCVINESLRLLTPNALMVRVTTQSASLNGVILPERCEVVLCPFVAHRDPERFPHPNEFLPWRWSVVKPSPFEYFPFGAGGHSCVGRHLAMHILKETTAMLVRKHELLLWGDQEIDWQVHIIFMPGSDPLMTVQKPGAKNSKAGKLLGPVAKLIDLNSWSRGASC